ncbi:MAG: CocE/NonD family hydrolase [Anaerolineales bacterium]|nr:CocE/NonD family hydrolase [Anaerolineales bacterium]
MSPDLYPLQPPTPLRIPARDGTILSATLWLPQPRTPDEKFPVVLEMIPYRKDDYRFIADHQRMTYLAQRGFAGCRLDIRGTGSSEGLARDEYTPEETQDGYDAVEWLAAQPWCNGNVGMWGKSYGGFTAIQVAILQPPHLKAIVPMYATDDRYTDDVHYIGGCMVVSEMAQYAVSQVGMNAMPPNLELAGTNWAEQWKARLENTPPWLIEWLKHPTDGPYWRSGSLAPDYTRIRCAMFLLGGWHDGYTDPVLRMMEKCTAPRKALIGNWTHTLPHNGYPGPNVDWMHEMVRFFDYWLKGIENRVMDEPALTTFRREYTPPAPFPPHLNGTWTAEPVYPPPRTTPLPLRLGDDLHPFPLTIDHSQLDILSPHPTHGTRDALCWGGGSSPNGLARDLRPDESLALTYTSEPLTETLDILGFPEAILHLSASAPVAHLVVRLNDLAPDGTVGSVTRGVLNLTHRNRHESPEPLTPGEIYEVRVQMKAAGYRFLPGHRIRLSVASAYWPVIWPAPYPAELTLHRGPATPSRLILPTLPGESFVQPPPLKTTPPELISLGKESYSPPVWQITQDVIKGTTTVKTYGDDTSILPDGTRIFTAEMLEMTTSDRDPAHTHLYTEVDYELEERYQTHIRATGSIRSTETAFHIDVQLQVTLNGNLFFQKSWLESLPRHLL